MNFDDLVLGWSAAKGACTRIKKIVQYVGGNTYNESRIFYKINNVFSWYKERRGKLEKDKY